MIRFMKLMYARSRRLGWRHISLTFWTSLAFALYGESALANNSAKMDSQEEKATDSSGVPMQDTEYLKYYRRRYNSDNIDKQFKDKPEPAPGLDDEVRSYVLGVMQDVTNNKKSKKELTKLFDGMKAPSDSDIRMKMAALEFEQSYYQADTRAEIYNHLRGEYRAEVERRAWGQMTFWNRIKSGVSFDLDFRKKKPKKEKTADKPSDNVRYGLVLQDIHSPVNQNLSAGLSTDTYEEWEETPTAEPIWTIAPIHNQDKMDLKQANVPKSLYKLDTPKKTVQTTVDEDGESISATNHAEIDDDTEQLTLADIANPASNLIDKFDPRFGGSVKPRTMPGVKQMPDQIPAMAFSLTQKQGLYSYQHLTQANMEYEGTRHNVSLPVFGTLRISRQYDESWRPISSGATGVLLSKALPAVSLSRDDIEHSYKAEMKYGIGEHNFKLTGESPSSWDPFKDMGTTSGEKYKLEYDYKF